MVAVRRYVHMVAMERYTGNRPDPRGLLELEGVVELLIAAGANVNLTDSILKVGRCATIQRTTAHRPIR
jgi:hypothetical protein